MSKQALQIFVAVAPVVFAIGVFAHGLAVGELPMLAASVEPTPPSVAEVVAPIDQATVDEVVQRAFVAELTPVPTPAFVTFGRHAIPAAVWTAIVEAFPEHLEYVMARAGWCESGYDTAAIGAHGEQGVWQVSPRWWGAVPSDLAGQARQAAAIAEQHGLAPWTTRNGCEEWR